MSSWPARIRWSAWLSWTLFLAIVYSLREFFFVAFVTFVLCYVVRSIVGRLSRRLSPDHPKVWLDRLLTSATFAVMAGILVGTVWWIGPHFVKQSRSLLARQQRFDPQATFESFLDRTVGAMLMRREYGSPQDSRYQDALREYKEGGRHGEGWFAQFSDLHAHLKSEFEAHYEQQQREQIEHRVRNESATQEQFDEWFLRVKAPELFAERPDVYLAGRPADRLPANQHDAQPDKRGNEPIVSSPDEQIRQAILRDVKADPVTLADLRDEWAQLVAVQHWRTFQTSPEYRQAFRDFYEQQRLGNPDGIPFDYETYEALRQAYPEGRDAFAAVLQRHARSADQPTESAQQLREDFEMSKRRELTQVWWRDDPTAAFVRKHAQEDLPQWIASLGHYLESLVGHLLKLPAQLVTALLLALFICFDMLHLSKSIQSLRVSRIGYLYDEIVPGLAVFSRLIGRSFAAQGLIAAANTLLTFGLLQLLGIGNSLFLCLFVFIGSFIPVLGVLLSSFPIALQAVLQPGGNLGLALQAIVGILVIHLIETSFLSPRIVGKVLHLHPVAVLVILAIGEHFFGLWGLLLGVPVAVYLLRVVILKEPIPGIYDPALEGPPAEPTA